MRSAFIVSALCAGLVLAGCSAHSTFPVVPNSTLSATQAGVHPAATPVIKQFRIPTHASGVTADTLGPDGNIWFVERAANKIGSVTPSGAFHEYVIPTAN